MFLLFSPYRLKSDHLIFETLHRVKNGRQNEFVSGSINLQELKSYFPRLTRELQQTLLLFERSSLKKFREQTLALASANNKTSEREAFCRNALNKRTYDAFNLLRNADCGLKYFHRNEVEKGRFLTEPCSLSVKRPSVQFKVVLRNGLLDVDPVFIIDGTECTPVRSAFLLHSMQVYYLLNWRDFQMIEWLEANVSRHNANQQDFSQHILSKLEDSYPVDRCGLIATAEIAVEPERRVLVREISNAFLLLTPQFIYDGHVCEGAFKPITEVLVNGTPFSIVRDEESERSFVNYLQQCHPNFSRQSNSEYYLPFADAEKKQWFLKLCKKFFAENIELVGLDLLKHFRYSPHSPATSKNVIGRDGHFVKMQFSVSFGKEKVPLYLLQKSLLEGQKVVVLEDGSFGVLTDAWMEEYSALLRHAKISGDVLLVSEWLSFTEEDKHGTGINHVPWFSRWKKWQEGSDYGVSLPAKLNIAQLRTYQQRGFEWLKLLSEAGAGACLADDMGLGKTIQTICFLAHRSELKPAAIHLVVCPTSLIYNWRDELEKFYPNARVIIYHGPLRDLNDIQDEEPTIVLTSYGTIRNDVEPLSSKFFDTVVLDESHHIKNPGSLITKAVLELKADMRVVLSGTPVMNDTFDLYAQFNFILPGLLGGAAFFKKQYADPIDRFKDESRIAALRKITAPFILRRTKEQVATDLPEKTETILWCSMRDEQREVYEEFRQNIRGEIFTQVKKNGVSGSSMSILQGMLRLRQICNSCELVNSDGITSKQSVKTATLLDELAIITDNHKVLVFSQFTSMLDLLCRDLSARSISYLRLDGSTHAAKRQELVEQFGSEEGNERVFLLSLKAGNAGLNLTAADYVFLFDPWWNPAVEQQAIDRTHRIGQAKKVFAYKMICKDTIEEKMLNLQKRKSRLSEELISGEESLLQQLTEEDLAYLFS